MTLLSSKQRIISHDDILEIRSNIANFISLSLTYKNKSDLPSVRLSVSGGMNKRMIEYMETTYMLRIVGCYKPNEDYAEEEDEIDIYFECANYLLNEIDQ